ncbi:SigE family RNA polymerase sigma factor [Micromonospora coxensis]|uniref:RNA polymerase sigma-70 factor, sigma-E family n=1 Tax=Micromonospora coxensis TaxID=356852 RepID=A0A1C5I2A7_9ACTN|nr:SigE family RNA polymerase sigma factor [Micromonospora coxensis]SCG52365.1 RNA polymerase sigma-70 factor, sigma-E family [Micromonospora coxensis]
MTFEEYVSSRGPALVRLARLLTGDEHRAEDLTQDVLARAYLHWRKIARADRPDVYVRRMLVNANTSWWRRRSSRELATAEFAERAGRGDLGGEAADRDEMWRLIRALPDRQRAVLVLRYYEDLDDTTIAQILDCSPVTVRTHAMRALTHLRERFAAPATNGSRP